MPVYQNDQATLADVVSPAYAAQQMGIQNDVANQEAQTTANINQATAPAKIAGAGLENLFKQAQTAQTGALTQGLDLGNAEKAGTLGSTIGATNAANQTKMTASQASGLGQLGQMAGQLAGYMDNIPGPARPAAMAQLLQSHNVDPQTLGVLASGDPDQLRQFSQKAVQASADYQTTFMKESMQGDTSRDVATIGASGKVQAADISAQARQYASDIAANAKRAAVGMGALQQQIYAKVANGTATPAERQALDSMNQVQQMTHAGSPFQSQITGTPTQANVPSVPNTSGGAPNSGDANQAAAKQTFGSYEPDKYEYGINPATGNFARRPKGK